MDTKILTTLATEARGLDYASAEATAIMDRADWAQHWPVIDTDGLLTGAVVETEETAAYANVQDLAMIDREGALAAGWTIDDDGYAIPPRR